MITYNEMIEGNLLIAQFMDEGIARQIKLKSVKPLTTAEVFVRTRKYHEDWNKLMNVLKKIFETIGYKSVDECTEEEWYASIGVTRLTITSELETVYNAVVRYIKWYNANK